MASSSGVIMTRVLGIDPGLTGALALVDGEHLVWVIDTPVIAKEVTGAALDDLYYVTRGLVDDPIYDAPVGIERVHSMPKQGVASTFTFGKSYGVMLGYFAARGHRILHINPTEWKGTFRLNGKDKDAARLVATELWPAHAQLFKRKKDIGRADAALIALHTARLIHSRHATGGTP